MTNNRLNISTDPAPRLRGYAQRIKTALHNHDRNDIELLDAQLLWSSPFETTLEDMTAWLVAQQLLTAVERDNALQLLPNIDNPSLKA